MAKKPEVGETWYHGDMPVQIMSFNAETAMCDCRFGDGPNQGSFKCHMDNLHELKKPPLGIHPKWLWEEQRRAELGEAITRYAQAGLSVPSEWVEEYNELVEKEVSKKPSDRNKFDIEWRTINKQSTP